MMRKYKVLFRFGRKESTVIVEAESHSKAKVLAGKIITSSNSHLLDSFSVVWYNCKSVTLADPSSTLGIAA